MIFIFNLDVTGRQLVNINFQHLCPLKESDKFEAHPYSQKFKRNQDEKEGRVTKAWVFQKSKFLFCKNCLFLVLQPGKADTTEAT